MLPGFPPTFEPAIFQEYWKLNELSRLVGNLHPIVTPPLVLEYTPAGALLRLQTGEGFLGILVEDATGSPKYENVATLQTQYMTLTQSRVGQVLMVPFIADYNKFGIVNLSDQWLGYGRKKFEKIQVGNDSSTNRYGIDFDYSFALNELILGPSDPSATGMLLNFKGQRWLRSGGTGVPTGRTLIEVFDTDGFLSYGFTGGPNGAGWLLIPYPAIPTGSPQWNWGGSLNCTFFSPGDVMTAKAFHVGVSDNPASTKSGITDTDPVGNKFAGGICYEKGATLVQTGIQWKDEGLNLGIAGTANTVDFVGSGVTASRSGNTITVTVTSGGVTDGDKGDVVVSGSGSTFTIDLNVVTYAKIQQVNPYKLLGNPNGTMQNLAEIGVSGLLSFSGGNLTAATTGATGTNIVGDTKSNGLTTAIGTGLSRLPNGVLAANQNLNPAWALIAGCTYNVPATGWYEIDGTGHGYIDFTGAGITYLQWRITLNGVAVADSYSIQSNQLAGNACNHQVPQMCPKIFCTTGQVLQLEGWWFGAVPGVCQAQPTTFLKGHRVGS